VPLDCTSWLLVPLRLRVQQSLSPVAFSGSWLFFFLLRKVVGEYLLLEQASGRDGMSPQEEIGVVSVLLGPDHIVCLVACRSTELLDEAGSCPGGRQFDSK